MQIIVNLISLPLINYIPHYDISYRVRSSLLDPLLSLHVTFMLFNIMGYREKQGAKTKIIYVFTLSVQTIYTPKITREILTK